MKDSYIQNCPVCYSVNLEYNATDRIYKCKNCRNVIKVKNGESDIYFFNLNMAEKERQLGDFDKAEAIYNDMLQDYQYNSNLDLKPIYWGKFLCDERVIFRKTKTDVTLPNFHEILPNRLTNYNKVLSLCSDDEQLETYESQYKKIKDVKDNYNSLVKSNTKPFDIFISFKSDRDYLLGEKIYNEFSAMGYNVFFSPKSLYNMKPNSEYTSNILYALKTSRVLLLLCSDKEYLNGSGWVRDEWKNFLRQMEFNKEKYIIPLIIGDFILEDLPRELLSMQSVFYSKDEKLENLKNIIKYSFESGERPTASKPITKAEDENEKYSRLKVGDLLKFGYYEGDAIEFEVVEKLENDRAFLVSKKIIDCMIFDEKTVDWKESSTRKWLNEDFYNSAFSGSEKERIDKYTTGDNVFLLSYGECKKYFKEPQDRQKEGTEYAVENGLWVSTQNKYSQGCSYYWLRTSNKGKILGITASGLFDSGDPDDVDGGIVPCIILKLKVEKNKVEKKEIKKEEETTVDYQTAMEHFRKILTPKKEFKLGGIIEFGTYKGKPLDFEVKEIKDKRAFLVSKNIIDSRKFDDSTSDWNKSEIKTWLNTKFYEEAFNDVEKSKIQTYATGDKVFLLSKEECEKFFPNSVDRQKKGTDYAKTTSLAQSKEGKAFYWLRSGEGKYVQYVYFYGEFYHYYPNLDSGGVVPCLIIEID